jgi:hypothetical protein
MSATMHNPSPPSPEAFLAECHRRGIRLTVSGETIKASGRPPARPEAFKAYLIAKKPELLKVLQAPAINPKKPQGEAPAGAEERLPPELAPGKANSTALPARGHSGASIPALGFQEALPSAEQWRAWLASDRSSPPPGRARGMTREEAGLSK